MQHLDAVRGGQRQFGQVLVGEHHHLAVGQFVPLGHVGVRNLFAVDRANPAKPDPPPVLPVDLAERDVPVLGRGIKPDGNHDEPERDLASPHGTHDACVPRLARLCSSAARTVTMKHPWHRDTALRERIRGQSPPDTQRGSLMSERDLGPPAPDLAEQRREAIDEPEDLPAPLPTIGADLPLDVDEADAMEQYREVELDEDDYR